MHNIARTEIQLNPRSEGGYDVLSTPNKPRGALRPPPHSPGYMSILYNNLKTVHHSNRHCVVIRVARYNINNNNNIQR